MHIESCFTLFPGLLFSPSVLTVCGLYCRCTIGLNVALMTLFFSLAITFFLLAAGQTHRRVLKVSSLDLATITDI